RAGSQQVLVPDPGRSGRFGDGDVVLAVVQLVEGQAGQKPASALTVVEEAWIAEVVRGRDAEKCVEVRRRQEGALLAPDRKRVVVCLGEARRAGRQLGVRRLGSLIGRIEGFLAVQVHDWKSCDPG